MIYLVLKVYMYCISRSIHMVSRETDSQFKKCKFSLCMKSLHMKNEVIKSLNKMDNG